MVPPEKLDAQVIAEAVAAFYETDRKCRRASPPAHQVILAITMVGTVPAFFKIPVTKKLLNCLNKGTYPSQKTTVLKYTPSIPDQVRHPTGMIQSGIRPLESRRIVFQAYEAFKSCIQLEVVRPIQIFYSST